MPKDYKIGLLVGLVLVTGAGLWLSVHPRLNARARISGTDNAGAEEGVFEQPIFEPNWAESPVVEIDTRSEQIKSKNTDTPRYHVVRDGETLSGISEQYYGSENKWREIFEANREIIQEPTTLKPGTKIIIPE
jgi:nucleoid-associated protein YgaU